MAEISPQVENQLRQYQETQQQLQTVLIQRQQMELTVRELEQTVTALTELADGVPIYRSVGTLLVGVKDAAALRSELAEQKETMEVRLKSVRRQEDGLRERLETLQTTLEKLLGGGPGARPDTS